jgi:hypothetical protein
MSPAVHQSVCTFGSGFAANDGAASAAASGVGSAGFFAP